MHLAFLHLYSGTRCLLCLREQVPNGMLVYGSYELYKKEIADKFPSLDAPQAPPPAPQLGRPAAAVRLRLFPSPDATPRGRGCTQDAGRHAGTGSRAVGEGQGCAGVGVTGGAAGALHLGDPGRHHGLSLDRSLREHQAGTSLT